MYIKLELERKDEMVANSAAVEDIAAELERLRGKAVTTSRDLLMARSTCMQVAVVKSLTSMRLFDQGA